MFVHKQSQAPRPSNALRRPELSSGNSETSPSLVRKFTATVPSGRSDYTITHNLQTKDVIVQTRIAGRIREGGISIIDLNNVQLLFGGILNEPIDIVILG